MCNLSRYPHGPQRRYDPDAFDGIDCHYAFRRKEQLVFNVGMTPDDMAVREIPRPSSHFGYAMAVAVEKEAVARSQHSLS